MTGGDGTAAVWPAPVEIVDAASALAGVGARSRQGDAYLLVHGRPLRRQEPRSCCISRW
jgi:hypothetical protein